MYKIVPAERQKCSEKTITKNRCKPSKNGLQRSFLAPPAGFEPVACRLGGDRSIQLSYGGLYRKYSILQGSRIRTIRFLGGDRSIQLSYGGLYRKYSILQGSRIRTIRFLGGACYIHLTTEAYAIVERPMAAWYILPNSTDTVNAAQELFWNRAGFSPLLPLQSNTFRDIISDCVLIGCGNCVHIPMVVYGLCKTARQ